MHPALEKIFSEDLAYKVGLWLPAATMRLVLAKQEETRALKRALTSGSVSEQALNDAVSAAVRQMLDEDARHLEVSLALVALVQEQRATLSARRYLTELAELNVVEFRHASAVARECLKHRPRTQTRTLHVSFDASSPPLSQPKIRLRQAPQPAQAPQQKRAVFDAAP